MLAMLAAWATHALAGQVTDMVGRQVTVPEVINKVYCTAPPATYLLYALDPDLLAGLNMPLSPAARPFMNQKVGQLPVVGGWFGQGQTPNIETLLQVKPDLVLGFVWRRTPANWKIEQTLGPLGIPLVYVTLDSLSEYPAALDFLGKLLNRGERAAELSAYIQKTLAQAATLRSAIPDRQKVAVYYAEGAQGLNTECNTSLHAELIPLCGGWNVHRCRTKTVHGMEKVSLEQVITYNPQVILTHAPMFLKKVHTDPRWKNIQAVRERRIHQIPLIPFNWFDRPPSFMQIMGAHWLMNRLYPERHPIDLVKETRLFYRLFLQVDLDQATARSLLAL
jgi:iron complex transport system substrate-binding protein